MAGSRFCAANAMIRLRRVSKYGSDDQQRSDPRSRQRRKARIQFAIVTGLDDQDLSAKFWRSQFQITYLICRRWIIRIDCAEDGDRRHHLLQNAEALLLHRFT